MATPINDRRQLVLEGAYHMRDLGGVPNAEGYSVRTGRFFRSDALHNLTPTDLEMLGAYGIASVIDLRSEREISTFGRARLTEYGARHIHVPLMGDEPLHPDGIPVPSMAEIYTMIAMKWPERFVHVMEALAMTDNVPVVFNCAAGKDRTGMTAALIYSILEVERELIVADYMLTDVNMDRILEIQKRNASLRGDKWVDYPASYNRAEAITITSFLNGLDQLHGSPVAWLRHHGLTDRAIESLRGELLA